MVRWQPDARGRLQEAALALFDERGFDDTTVARIAEQAGLTKRTFFRYFADKREVLFSGSQELTELFVSAVAAAPPSASPLDAVIAGLDAVASMFAGRRDFAARRQQIIAANPELQERELIKLSSLAGAVAAALRLRGADESVAVLAAEAGITVFRVGFERWVDAPDREELRALIHQALDELRGVTAA
jgi:AcrR family transcriptional regulator